MKRLNSLDVLSLHTPNPMRNNHGTCDGIVVGAGVVGLAIAYELSRQGLCVHVIDRQQPGREASWAGAGLLPPGSWYTDAAWADVMAAASREQFPLLAAELYEQFGHDCQFARCGGTYLVADASAREIEQKFARWSTLGIGIHPLDQRELAEVEPALQPRAGDFFWHAPQEAQVRNPRLLRALAAAVVARGSKISAECEAQRLMIDSGRCTGVETASGRFSAGFVCVATGAWSSELLEASAPTVRVRPIRGQMLLLKEAAPTLRGNVHLVATATATAGSAYAVPRRDGHTLVGSTIEDVGFDKSTTRAALERFRGLARGLTSGLATAAEVSAWSGLRPGSHDEAPYIGSVPDVDNLFVATGHYRTGLQFAPPTAQLIGSMVLGTAPPCDPTPFRIER